MLILESGNGIKSISRVINNVNTAFDIIYLSIKKINLCEPKLNKSIKQKRLIRDISR